MPTFITQGRYTREAIKGMVVKPEDRAEAISRLLSKAGGRLIGYYLTFGEYDFLVICEAPGETQMAAVLLATGGSGGVTDLQVAQVELDLLESRNTVLTLERNYLDNIDFYKQQLGVPATLALELDDGPLRPIRRHMSLHRRPYQRHRSGAGTQPPCRLPTRIGRTRPAPRPRRSRWTRNSSRPPPRYAPDTAAADPGSTETAKRLARAPGGRRLPR